MRRRAVLMLFLAAVAAGCASHASQASFVPIGEPARRESALAALPSPTAPGMAIGVYYNGNPYYYYQGGPLDVARRRTPELGD